MCCLLAKAQIVDMKHMYIESLRIEKQTSDSIFFQMRAEMTQKWFEVWQLVTAKDDTVWVKGKLSQTDSIKGNLYFQLAVDQYKKVKNQTITHFIDCPSRLSLEVVNKQKVKLKKPLIMPLKDQVIIHSYGTYGKKFFNNADTTIQFIKLNFSSIAEKRDLPKIGLKLDNGEMIVLDKVGKSYIDKQTFRYKGFTTRWPHQFVLHITDETLEKLASHAIEQLLMFRNEIRKIEVMNPQKIKF